VNIPLKKVLLARLKIILPTPDHLMMGLLQPIAG